MLRLFHFLLWIETARKYTYFKFITQKQRHILRYSVIILLNEYKFEMFMRKYIEIEQKCCKQHFYNWEDSSVLLILVASSQPCLIFSIFFLKHGRSSMHLHTRTTIGRKTAIIKVGGVYHTNCFISTHLFQAKISACIVPSRRETIPSLLCKRKKIILLKIGSISLFHLTSSGSVQLLGNSFIHL